MRSNRPPSEVLLVAALGLLLGCDGVRNPDVPTEPPSPLGECTIEADGELTSGELPFAPGLAARYVRNEPSVDIELTVGLDQGESEEPFWDLSVGPTDVGATLRTEGLDGLWFEEDFGEASFTLPLLVESPELLGVYRWDPAFDGIGGRLLLLGVATVSNDEPARTTLIRYDEPVTTLQLPLRAGQTWGGQVTFRDALVAGLPEAGVEDWLFQVEAIGTAAIAGDLEISEVVQLRSSVTRTLAVAVGDPTSQLHTVAWIAPCFGQLASASGPSLDLSVAAEFRRIYP